MAVTAVCFVLALAHLGIAPAVAVALLFVVFFLLFRDPRRDIPASPLGVVSPVDGRVVTTDLVDRGVFQREARRVVIKIDTFGAYSARSPVEGQIKDLLSVASEHSGDHRTNALWVHTDEGDDVVVQFRGYPFRLAPKSFLGFGQRVGQGQRCAYLRLTRFAEVQMPIETKIVVKPGDALVAGMDLIGKLTHS